MGRSAAMARAVRSRAGGGGGVQVRVRFLSESAAAADGCTRGAAAPRCVLLLIDRVRGPSRAPRRSAIDFRRPALRPPRPRAAPRPPRRPAPNMAPGASATVS